MTDGEWPLNRLFEAGRFACGGGTLTESFAMNELSDKAKSLRGYCRENGRFCPQPDYWNQLWKMLPDHNRKTSGVWNPPLPLILAAWSCTGLEKIMRLDDHIRWADEHSVIDEVDAYLRSLTEEQWFHGRD